MTLELREIGPSSPAEAEEAWRAAAAFVADGLPAPGDAPLPPEARRLLAWRGGKVVGRVGFGAREGFTGVPGVTGYVGWYAAGESEAGAALLREAADRLLRGGAERVVGPMDGSTWYRYRIALPGGPAVGEGEPFLSEPRNPPAWVQEFEQAGFGPLLEYETRLVREPRPDPEMEARRAQSSARGVRIRPLDLDRFEEELGALYELSAHAFAAAPFYSPISRDDFVRLYAGLRPLIDPALVRLAEDAAGRLLACIFAFPDAFAPPHRPRIVLKTLAAHRDASGMGLAGLLVDDIHTLAAARGAAVLHALMHVSNVSENMSRRRGSELFRSYRLYGRERG